MATKVYGQSDDLIEFEGDISDEIGAYGDEPRVLTFSDGTVLQVMYGKPDLLGGVWGIQVVKAGPLFERIDECTDEDAKPYSDIAHFKDGLAFVSREVDEDGDDDPRILAKGYTFTDCAACCGTGQTVKPTKKSKAALPADTTAQE